MKGMRFVRLARATALILLSVLCLSGCFLFGDDDKKTDIAEDYETMIPDSALRGAIAEALGKSWGSITLADLAGLAELEAYDLGIVSLTGIGYCVGLEYLTLSSNSISDFAPLSALSKLRNLDLAGNSIDDLAPLVEAIEGLKSLTELMLNNNAIGNLSPLASLEQITFLQLHNNLISDISPLSELSSIAKLYIGYNPITYSNLSATITPAAFPSLVGLDIGGRRGTVEYVTVAELQELLSRFPSLRNIRLRNFPTMTDDELATILDGRADSLRQLRLVGCASLTTATLFAISSFPNLTTLDLQATAFYEDDLTILATAAWIGNLKSFTISYCSQLTNAAILSTLYDAGAFHTEGAEIYMYNTGIDTAAEANAAVLAALETAGVTIYY